MACQVTTFPHKHVQITDKHATVSKTKTTRNVGTHPHLTRPFFHCWRNLANTNDRRPTSYDVHTKFHGDLMCRFEIIVIYSG